MAQTVENLPVMQKTQVQSLDQEDLLEKEMATYSCILPGKFYGRTSLVATAHGVTKESDTTK